MKRKNMNARIAAFITASLLALLLVGCAESPKKVTVNSKSNTDVSTSVSKPEEKKLDAEAVSSSSTETSSSSVASESAETDKKPEPSPTTTVTPTPTAEPTPVPEKKEEAPVSREASADFVPDDNVTVTVGGYRFSVPSNWVVSGQNTDKDYVYFAEKGESEFAALSAGLVDRPDTAIENRNKYVAFLIAELENEFDDVECLADSDVTINGIPFVKLAFHGEIEGRIVDGTRMYLYDLESEDPVFFLGMMQTPNTERNYFRDASMIMTSVESVDGVEYEDDVEETATPGTPADNKSAAVISANYHLDNGYFTRDQLIDTLMYDGYSYDDAVYGVDHCYIDWNTGEIKTDASNAIEAETVEPEETTPQETTTSGYGETVVDEASGVAFWDTPDEEDPHVY